MTPLSSVLYEASMYHANVDTFDEDALFNPFINLNTSYCYGLILSAPAINPVKYKHMPSILFHISTRDQKGRILNEPYRVSSTKSLPRIPTLEYLFDKSQVRDPLLNELIPEFNTYEDLIKGLRSSEQMDPPFLGVTFRLIRPYSDNVDFIFKSKEYRRIEAEEASAHCDCHK